MNSDLASVKSSLELDFTEPVVVGSLGLVVSQGVQSYCSSDVSVHWFVQKEVDHLLFKAASACHG